MKDATKCLHAGYHPKNTEPRVLPIVQSTTYVFDSTEDVAAVFDDPSRLPDPRPAKEQFAEWFSNKTAFDPKKGPGGWRRMP